jgi:pyruvate formate lyase activating enzyme
MDGLPGDTRDETEGKDPPKSPLILEIKGNSLDDGPGIRTVVFFKGCPLSCSWCHNPEAKSAVQEISFDPEECIDCEACLEACRYEALEPNNPYFVNRELCTLCFECVEVCPSGALSRVGRRMDVREVAAEIAKDIPFFETSGGGVTLSGGEPTLFMDYASRLLVHMKRLGIHTLVETSGYFDLARFERKILPFTDLIYFDLKIFDDVEHKKHCGTSNATIMENFRKLLAAYRNGGVEVIPRIPLIPGITATRKNLTQLVAFLRENGADEVALLPYNPLWMEKGRKIGQQAGLTLGRSLKSWMKAAEIRRCQAVFEGFELR